jgi:hypothetical protein
VFDELASVALIHDIQDKGLETGDVGVVVSVEGGGAAYWVEFVLTDGRTAALLLLKPHDLTLVEAVETDYRRHSTATLPHVTLTTA